MSRSLLHCLPDIVTAARERSRQLLAALAADDGPLRRRARPREPQRIRLLCGNTLPALLGLLGGQGNEPSLRAQIPRVWLADALPAPLAGPAPVEERQRRTRALVELPVTLFVARELMSRDGLLVTAADDDPDQCVRRLLDTVFGRTRLVSGAPGTDPGFACYLAGGGVPCVDAVTAGPELLGELASRCTRADDAVLVVPADPSCAAWVAELDRRWVLVQPDALGFALLREHIVARRLALQPPQRSVQEHRRTWAVLS